MTSSKYTRAIYQQLIIVKWSLFDGKEDGVFVTFQKDCRQLCKHWNSVIAMHTQIFQSSEKSMEPLQLRLENSNILVIFLRCTLSLRQTLAAESSLKMMKKAFCFTSIALFVLKIFKFLSWLFGHAAKLLAKKDKVNFTFYDVTAWLTNNCNTHIAQYLEQ